MNCIQSWARCRRGGGGWWALGAAVLFTALVTGCGVTRAPIDTRSDPAALPNLKRASEALQERIVREKEHVTGLNRQLTELLASEARVYAEVFEAEGTYQQLRADADDVQADVAAVEAELEELRRKLETRRVEREAARLELASLEAELEAEREAGMEARREIEFWRGGLDASGEVTAFRKLRLEEFRKRWEVPEDKWAALMGDLGLTAVLIDPEDPPRVEEPEPLPPDSLPPPEDAVPAVEEGADAAGEDGAVGS